MTNELTTEVERTLRDELFSELLGAWDHLDVMIARAERSHRASPEVREIVKAREAFRIEFYGLLPKPNKGIAAARQAGPDLW